MVFFSFLSLLSETLPASGTGGQFSLSHVAPSLLPCKGHKRESYINYSGE